MATRGRKPKTTAEKKAFSGKVGTLMREGAAKNTKQAAAIAYSELRKGGLKRLKRNSGKKRSGRARAA